MRWKLALDSLALARAGRNRHDARRWPPNDLSDGELISRIGDGDRDAFERPLPALRAAGVRARPAPARRPRPRRGRGAGDVRLDLARRPRSYRPERGPGAPWLYAVARNAIVDRGRARARAAGRGAGHGVRRRRARPSGPRRAGRAWRVHRALEELPDHERTRDRARLLERPLAERDRRVPEHPARHRQDAHPRGARRGSPTCSRRSSDDRRPELRRARRRDDLRAEERARLQRVHELLVAAGPPPELPPRLLQEPDPERRAPRQRRRPAAPPRGRAARARRGARARRVRSAASSSARTHAPFDEDFAVPMHGTAAGAQARAPSIHVGEIDDGRQLAAARSTSRTCPSCRRASTTSCSSAEARRPARRLVRDVPRPRAERRRPAERAVPAAAVRRLDRRRARAGQRRRTRSC